MRYKGNTAKLWHALPTNWARYVTRHDLQALQRELGLPHELRSEHLLESALAAPRMEFGGFEAYPMGHEKAAVLMRSIILNHPFIDGNKRAGVVAAVAFLEMNRLRCTASNDEMYDAAVGLAKGTIDTEAIIEFFAAHIVHALG